MVTVSDQKVDIVNVYQHTSSHPQRQQRLHTALTSDLNMTTDPCMFFGDFNDSIQGGRIHYAPAHANNPTDYPYPVATPKTDWCDGSVDRSDKPKKARVSTANFCVHCSSASRWWTWWVSPTHICPHCVNCHRPMSVLGRSNVPSSSRRRSTELVSQPLSGPRGSYEFKKGLPFTPKPSAPKFVDPQDVDFAIQDLLKARRIDTYHCIYCR